MLFTQDEEMNWIPLVYDFQYAGKGSCGKDLAKFLTCGTANIEDEEQYGVSLYRFTTCHAVLC